MLNNVKKEGRDPTCARIAQLGKVSQRFCEGAWISAVDSGALNAQQSSTAHTASSHGSGREGEKRVREPADFPKHPWYQDRCRCRCC